ncbi:MAG: DUF4175 family protein, partial [Variibacter sp.]|nr:DUF4175 family protein [Variibacter sp.]
MTERFLGMPEGRPQGSALLARSILDRALTRAWWALLWERLWPRLVLVSTVLALFLVVSWAGLWQMLPATGRMIGVGLFALALLGAAFPFIRLGLPSRDKSLQRVDRSSGLPHRPATALTDTLATGLNDKGSEALWQAHLARTTAAAKSFKAGAPRPGLA